jgi:hypothetical protein
MLSVISLDDGQPTTSVARYEEISVVCVHDSAICCVLSLIAMFQPCLRTVGSRCEAGCLLLCSYHVHCCKVLCKCENCPKRGGRPSVTLDRTEPHGKYARVRLECVTYRDHRASLR